MKAPGTVVMDKSVVPGSQLNPINALVRLEGTML